MTRLQATLVALLAAFAGLGGLVASDGVSAERAPLLRLVTLSTQLRQPTYVAATASEPSRLYVVERQGVIRIFERGRLRAAPFLDIATLVSTAGERGLLSMAFHPQYQTNRLFYVAYTDRTGAITLAAMRSNGTVAIPASRETLVRIEHDESVYHNGGQLQFRPNGLLYVSTGDGGYFGPQPDPHGNSQNVEVLLGKIFTLDVDAQNPQPHIVAYGVRNPWRFSFDDDGAAWIGDVGWNGVEEVNRLGPDTPLTNFGWSVYEGRQRRRSGGEPPPLNPQGELTWPLATYSTRVNGNCSIAGGYVYHGHAVPRLAGRYVFGDYCSGRIWSARVAGGKLGQRRLEPVRAKSLTSFGRDARGELYVVTLTGRLYRLAR